jgi:hypothetical protein
MTILKLLWRLIVGGLWKPILAVVGLLALYTKGRADAKAKADLRDLKGFKKTTERMQDADAAMGDDPDALRQWLKERAEHGRDVR